MITFKQKSMANLPDASAMLPAAAGRSGDDFSHYNLETLNKFIIAIVRNDKYCEGYLASKFSDGTILSILKAAESIISHQESGR